MSGRIPARQPIGDSLTGTVARHGAQHYFITGSPESGDIVASGTFTIRYAVRYLGKPHMAIVPGLLALDYGEMLTGDEAWQFLLKRSNLYPRADVVGYRHDGVDDMVPVKQLDLMQPVMLLAYQTEDDTQPLAEIVAVITQQPDELPPNIQEHAQIYPTEQAWIKANGDG